MIRFSWCRFAVLSTTVLNLSAQQHTQPETEDKRILWIFTNHRTTDDSAALSKLTPKGKLAIVWGDATDRAIFFQTAVLADIGQANNSNPSFGQGMEGYAISRLFITRTDSGRSQFNYSEVLGSATSLAISNAYYQDGQNGRE